MILYMDWEDDGTPSSDEPEDTSHIEDFYYDMYNEKD